MVISNIDRLEFAILDDALATYFGMTVRGERKAHRSSGVTPSCSRIHYAKYSFTIY